MRRVDINSDMGESYGRWRLGDDAAMLSYVSSVNLACGFHAGDPQTLITTVRAAAEKGVAIGAHPGLPDLLGFGRRQMELTPEELYAYIVTQVGTVHGALMTTSASLHHVKLHAALTYEAYRSEEHAAATAQAIIETAPEPRVYWRASPTPDYFSEEARRRGIEVVLELYPDLVYAPDGELSAPRDGVFASTENARQQVRRALADGEVMTGDGGTVPIQFDSICVHGDGPRAVSIVRAVRETLEESDCQVMAQAA